ALAQAQQDLAAARQEAAATADAPEVRAQLAEAQAGAAERSQLVGELKRTLEEARSELTILRASMASTSDLEAARRECQEAQAAIVELQFAAAAAQADASAARERTAVADAAALAAQAALAQAEADAALERESLRPAAEFDQLQHKFDLALADVQVLKRECSSLRQELAERPQASEAESPELISVRQQRDALAARVEELEADAAAGAAGDVDAQQERDDLERRFQMAVDDLRQLKQENAILRERAETAPRGASSSETPAGGDWASQRARLMALLEEEDESGEISAERVAERATVAKTMAATDRVIASKDEEIAELRTALQTRSEGAAMDQQDAAARTALFDADEVIAAERRRIAQMSAEWEEKLRAAELEFSVQRAKLAREQAAVRERMLEIESAAHATASNPGEPGKPRRRWLAALGLNDEDDAKAK
ncbi:MAG TPA: hypothetical protein VEQ85_08510, partial [Lacipirellulaceae bacterium]|nr:hypothetical protein [Lacipirellulaceae bacterium]